MGSRDGGALDVPAGSTRSQRRVLPGRFAPASSTPQQWIEPVALADAIGVAATLGEDLIHLLSRPSRHLTERIPLSQIEIDIPGRRRDRRGFACGGLHRDGVCRAVGEEFGHRIGDGRHRLLHTDELIGWDHGQRGHVVPEEIGLLTSQVAPIHAVALGPLEEGVVDVGDVLDHGHVDAGVADRALEHVKGHIGCGMPEMGGVVGGDATDVHREVVGLGGGDEFAGDAVAQEQEVTLTGDMGQEGTRPGLHDGSLRRHGHSAGQGMAGQSDDGDGNRALRRSLATRSRRAATSR